MQFTVDESGRATTVKVAATFPNGTAAPDDGVRHISYFFILADRPFHSGCTSSKLRSPHPQGTLLFIFSLDSLHSK